MIKEQTQGNAESVEGKKPFNKLINDFDKLLGFQ